MLYKAWAMQLSKMVKNINMIRLALEASENHIQTQWTRDLKLLKWWWIKIQTNIFPGVYIKKCLNNKDKKFKSLTKRQRQNQFQTLIGILFLPINKNLSKSSERKRRSSLRFLKGIMSKSIFQNRKQRLKNCNWRSEKNKRDSNTPMLILTKFSL